MILRQWDDIIEALASQGADHTLTNSVGFWTMSRRFYRLDASILNGAVKVDRKDAVAVMEQVSDAGAQLE